MFSHPFFWRHFCAAVLGAACLRVGLAYPSAAPALIPVGGALLGLTGTSILEPKDKVP